MAQEIKLTSEELKLIALFQKITRASGKERCCCRERGTTCTKGKTTCKKIL